MNDRIYIFSPPQVFGGAEVYQIRLAELLQLRQLFTVVSPISPSLQSGILNTGGEFFELAGSGSVAVRVSFLSWLWRHRAMLSSNAAALMLNGRGAAYFAPVVKFISGIAPVVVCHTELTEDRLNIKQRMFGFALRFSRCIIAVSETVAAQHRQRWPELKVIAIPNWIDAAPYVNILDKYRTSIISADVAVVGRLAENKGILDVVTVFKDVKGPFVHFYGSGPLQKTLTEMAVSSPRLKVHGHVDELWKQLSRHNILLSASYSESFSYSVAEGIYAGLVCVVSDIPAHRELLGPEYPENLYFSAGDQVGLKAALEAALVYLSRTDGAVEKIIGLAKMRMDSRNGAEQARKHYRAVLLRST